MANARVLEAAGASLTLVGMGTTIVAALVRDQTIAVAHVGDSRLYLFANGALRLLTRDDCWALNRHVLTNVLGTRQQVDVHVVEAPLTGGEIAVLTTDGIHATIDDACIERLVAAGGEPADIAQRLVKKAVGSGSRDNCTAVVGRC
jgi:protein phosphatase